MDERGESMSGLEGMMGRMNDLSKFMGTVQGTMDTMAPALATLNYGVTNVAQVMNGYAPSAYYPTYPQGGYVPGSTGTTTGLGDDNIGLGLVGGAVGGGIGGFLASKAVAASKAVKAVTGDGAAASVATSAAKTGFLSGLKAVGSAALKGTGIGAAVGGVFSLVNGLIKGERGSDLAGSVVADTAGGAASGLAATCVGGLAVAGLAALGVGGLGLTLAGAGVGILGGMAADALFRKTGARQMIKDLISNH
jgi:hypothetical protein